MSAQAIGYWATTGLLAAGMVSGGVAELTQRPETIEGMVQLGYPAYFISHLVGGSAVWHLVVTGAFVLLTIASWALRPRSRVLGTLVPAWSRRQALPADGAAGMAIAPTRGA